MPSFENKQRNSGFSLVEIMIGMVIGLLGILIIMQVFTVSESRKRTATSGDDAQSNSAIALYGMKREIQQSGYGISSVNILGCDILLRTGVTLNNLSPATINHPSIPAGDNGSDTLLLVYGNANGAAEGDKITGQPTTNIYGMQTAVSFAANNYVIAQAASRPNSCSLLLDMVTAVSVPNVTVTSGSTGMSNGSLFNLGAAPKILVYAVRNANLTVCDYLANDCSLAANVANPSIWIPIASNIVSLRAQYGRDTNNGNMDAVVDTYDQTVATTATTPAVTSTQCGWLRVSSIRIALVARSATQEIDDVTSTAPIWAGYLNNPITLTSNANWRKFRYKTFQTYVPIKNIAWQGVVAGC